MTKQTVDPSGLALATELYLDANGALTRQKHPDGMVDVKSINGGPALTPADYAEIGGLVPAQLFLGNLEISPDGLTVTRANGSELGSFVDEGFEPGNLIRLRIDGVEYDREISEAAVSVTDDTLSLDTALPVTGLKQDVAISLLTRQGIWEGEATITQPAGQGWQVIREDGSSWLGDGFLEGQWVQVCVSDGAGACVVTTGRFKIQVIRGESPTKDEKLEFRFVDGVFEDDLSESPGGFGRYVNALADYGRLGDSRTSGC
jgi:hypothetical protein